MKTLESEITPEPEIINPASRQGKVGQGLGRSWLAAALGLAVLLAGSRALRAGNLYVPNYSFESPDIGTNTPYAAPVLDSWTNTPQPGWYDPSEFYDTPWADLVGTFYNLPNFTNIVFTNGAWMTNSNVSWIDNCDGIQAAFLQALPQVAIVQDLNTPFKVDKTYTLTVGLIGGGGNMPEGSTFQLSLYYRDASSNMVTVAATTVTNTQANFPTNTHLVDFQVQVPGVQASNAWAGQNMGIQLLATPDPEDPNQWGGYWDADNVRLQEAIYVPNYSFESPDIGTNSPYAAPVLDSWTNTPQPGWYDPSEFYDTPWADLVGTFYNLPNFTNIVFTNGAWMTNSNVSWIDNCDGIQAAFFQALPQVGILQDLNAPFKAGKTYTLTVGLIGGGGNMPEGSTFQLSLYYRDASSNMVSVATTTVTNTLANFPTNTHLVDFQAQVPGVKTTDPWAGQSMGIQLLATPDPYDPSQWGGYWDADNVRLVETTALNLANPAKTAGAWQFTVQSEPNVVCQILAAGNLALPLTNWTSLGTFTNITGNMPFVDSTPGAGPRFYTARQLP